MVFKDVPHGVEVPLWHNENFLVTSAMCEERNRRRMGMLGKIKVLPPISWDWLEMSCFVQSFTETSCENFCSIFRKEGRQKRQKEKRNKGEREKKRGEEGGGLGLTCMAHRSHTFSKVSSLDQRNCSYLVAAALTIVQSF